MVVWTTAWSYNWSSKTKLLPTLQSCCCRYIQKRTGEHLKSIECNFGSSKDKPSVDIQSDYNASLLQSYISETESLRKQVAQLQMQLNSKKPRKENKQGFKAAVPTNNSPTPVGEAQAQPKAWFCFKCGEDGLIARNCDKPLSKALVDQKYTELKHKQISGRQDSL